MLLPSLLPYRHHHQTPPSLLASALPYNQPLANPCSTPILSTPPSERFLSTPPSERFFDHSNNGFERFLNYSNNGFEQPAFDIDLQAVVEKCRALHEMIGMYRCSGGGRLRSRARASRGAGRSGSGRGDVKGGSGSGKSGKRRGKEENKISKLDRRLQATRISTTTTTTTTTTPTVINKKRLALPGSDTRKSQSQPCTNNEKVSTTGLLHLHDTLPCTPPQYHPAPPHLPLGLSRADFSFSFSFSSSSSMLKDQKGGKGDQLEVVGVGEGEWDTWELI